MRRLVLPLLGLCACAALVPAGCTARKSAGTAPQAAVRRYETLEGTVTYFERMAMPGDARLVVWLGEEGRLSDPKARLAEREMPIEGQVPVRFDLSYAPDAVDPAVRYAIAAEFRVDGQPWFASPAPVGVAVRDGKLESPVAIVVRRTAEGVPQ